MTHFVACLRRPRDWTDALVAKFYRPIKKSVTVRFDANVLAWLKSRGKGYQTRINRLLRTAMENKPRRRARSAGGISVAVIRHVFFDKLALISAGYS